MEALNPWYAKFVWENIQIYLHFLSFLNTEVIYVAETLSDGRQGPISPLYNKYQGCWCPTYVRS